MSLNYQPYRRVVLTLEGCALSCGCGVWLWGWGPRLARLHSAARRLPALTPVSGLRSPCRVGTCPARAGRAVASATLRPWLTPVLIYVHSDPRDGCEVLGRRVPLDLLEREQSLHLSAPARHQGGRDLPARRAHAQSTRARPALSPTLRGAARRDGVRRACGHVPEPKPTPTPTPTPKPSPPTSVPPDVSTMPCSRKVSS